ncbi:MAG TPA: carbon-nitrogen hydrolase family protein [Candidatus Dormibacteraeota bacterium]|nr:carbon-nitrogen hydrolase family protein [Candidatus Dormibacteraeota bacterium]
MRIALAQIAGGPDKGANLRHMVALTGEAARAGARLVVFPECAMVHLPPGQDLAPLAEPLDGPFVTALADAARRDGIAVVAGLFEPAPGPDARVLNTVVALGPDGARLGEYRKIHLYDAFGYRESDRIRAGAGDTLLFALDGVTFGVETCYDVRFPELTRHLAARGAEVVLLPAAWVPGPLKDAHWEVLVRARAIESTVYVAAAGMAAPLGAGSSMLVDPMGVAVVRAGEGESLLAGDAEPERLRAVRRANPSLENARPDVYAGWVPMPATPARS